VGLQKLTCLASTNKNWQCKSLRSKTGHVCRCGADETFWFKISIQVIEKCATANAYVERNFYSINHHRNFCTHSSSFEWFSASIPGVRFCFPKLLGHERDIQSQKVYYILIFILLLFSILYLL
jgi:hypothetical protein